MTITARYRCMELEPFDNKGVRTYRAKLRRIACPVEHAALLPTEAVFITREAGRYPVGALRQIGFRANPVTVDPC